MRTAALALAHLLLSAALAALSGGVAFPAYGAAFSAGPAVRAVAGAALYVLQLPLGPLAHALGAQGPVMLVAAVGNAVLWAWALGALWRRARR